MEGKSTPPRQLGRTAKGEISQTEKRLSCHLIKTAKTGPKVEFKAK